MHHSPSTDVMTNLLLEGQILQSLMDETETLPSGPLDINDSLPSADAQRLIDEAVEKHRHYMQREQASLASLAALIEKATWRHQASMERHDTAILALQSQRNSYTAISRLPPEVLCNIFLWAREYDSEDLIEDEDGTIAKTTLTWVNVSHVCRHWRNGAIGSPSLWTHLPFRNLAWLKVMLERSKEAGLVVNYHDGWDHLRRSDFIFELEEAFEHCWRIQHLCICTKTHVWPETLPEPDSSFPQLESLCLSCSYVAPKLERPIYDPWGEDPRPIFGTETFRNLNAMPRLRSLELNYYEAKWGSQSSFLHGLTHLKLNGSSPAPGVTWQWFIDTLRNMRHLQVLDLRDSFPVCSDKEMGHVHSYGSVHLGCLRNLSLACDAKEAGIILSCVTFPPTALIKVDCCFDLNVVIPVPSIDFANIFVGLAQIYADTASSPSFQTLALLQAPCTLPGARMKLFERALTDEQMLRAHNDDIPAHLEIIYTWASRYGPRDEIADKAANDIFNSGLPLQNIKHVYLMDEIDGFVGPTALANTIGELPELCSIVTVEGASRDLVDALQLDEDQSPDIPFERTYFPRLTSIFFYGTRFRPSYYFEYNPEDDLDHLPIELLNDCLVQLSTTGARLSRLTFRLCRKLYKADVDTFRGTVDEIDWDEEEITFDPDDEESSEDSETEWEDSEESEHDWGADTEDANSDVEDLTVL